MLKIRFKAPESCNLQQASISLVFCLLLGSKSLHAEALYLPQEIQYGRVVAHHIHKIDPSYGRGAILGAITGAVVAENARGWGALGGAIVGAGLEGAITSGQEAHKVVVRLVNGQSFSIATPPNNLRTGDCVAVEQSDHGAELFKVSHQFCEEAQPSHRNKPNSPPNDHYSSTFNQSQPHYREGNREDNKEEQCDKARAKLRYAKDSEYNRVLADVQRYCQD